MRSNNRNKRLERTGLKRLVGSLLCVALLSAPVASALALDKNQIVQMSKLGLDDRAIMGAIDAAGDELELTPEEFEELKKQGVKASVLEHLKNSGHVQGAKPAAPAPPAPPVPGGDFDLEPAPAPAPGEGETDEDREERERLERERAAEIEKNAAADAAWCLQTVTQFPAALERLQMAIHNFQWTSS